MFACKHCNSWIQGIKRRLEFISEEQLKKHKLERLYILRDELIPQHITDIYTTVEKAMYEAEKEQAARLRELMESEAAMEQAAIEHSLDDSQDHPFVNNLDETMEDSRGEPLLADDVLSRAYSTRHRHNNPNSATKVTFAMDKAQSAPEAPSTGTGVAESGGSVQHGEDDSMYEVVDDESVSAAGMDTNSNSGSGTGKLVTQPKTSTQLGDTRGPLNTGHSSGGTPLSPLNSTALTFDHVITGTNLDEQLKAILEAPEDEEQDSASDESTTVTENDWKLLIASKVAGTTKQDGSNSDPAEFSAHSDASASSESHSETSAAEGFAKSRSTTLRPMPVARQTRSAAKKEKESRKENGSKAQRSASRTGDGSEHTGSQRRSPRKHQPSAAG
jgi:hypothetical protein